MAPRLVEDFDIGPKVVVLSISMASLSLTPQSTRKYKRFGENRELRPLELHANELCADAIRVHPGPGPCT